MFNNSKLERQSKDIDTELKNTLKDKYLEKYKIEQDIKLLKANISAWENM